MKEFFKNKLFVSGFVIVSVFMLLAIFAPFIAGHHPSDVNINKILLPPSLEHPMGTDELGRDVFSRFLYGARVSIFVGIISVAIRIVIGLLIGAIAGYYGGIIDSFLMRFVDVMLTFPTFFLLLALVAFLEQSIFTVMAVIGATTWMGLARLVRAEVLSLKERGFVEASRALGSGDMLILLRHILPNAMGPVIVSAILGVAGAILTESGLSFLGLGVPPPTPSWGNIIFEGKDNLDIAPWLSFFPGIAILITVLGFNLMGDGISEVTQPKSSKIKRG